MSVSNNIAEGSGSNSKKEFVNFLGIAKRSAHENANIVIILQRRRLIGENMTDELLNELDLLCRKIKAVILSTFASLSVNSAKDLSE